MRTVFEPKKLFRTNDVNFYPDTIEAVVDLKPSAIADSEIDIVITAHDLPEMTNLTIQNYLLHEKQTKIHIIVVDSSTKDSVFESLYKHERVSRILLKTDVKIKGNVHGYGSYGMALSAGIGASVCNAPYVFFSHSDMIACGDNFLSFLKSKLSGKTRLASFTQRHIIPFMGSMLLKREVLNNPLIDWLPADNNNLLGDTGLKDLAETVYHLKHVDCGEQYIYYELANRNPVFIAASRGGSTDWWKDPQSYYEAMTPEQIVGSIKKSGAPFEYAPLQANKDDFAKSHADLIKAGNEGWWFFEKPKWWRYSFDDNGKLIFIHHGRGTTLKAVKRWLIYVRNYNEMTAQRLGTTS